MTPYVHKLKLQKFGPIDRDYPIFEIIDEDGVPLLDVTAANDGTVEIAITPTDTGKIMPYGECIVLIQRAYELLQAEIAETENSKQKRQ